MLRNIRTYISNTGELVSRFRSSHHYAARSSANFGIKGTLAIYDSSAVFGFEVPTQTRGYNDRNFKSTALGCVLICGRPAKCKRFFRRIGTLSDAAICPASDAAMELR